MKKLFYLIFSIVLAISISACSSTNGYLPAEGATWGDLCQHFEPEWYDSLPDEVKSQYDVLLLGEIPPKEGEEGNEDTGNESAAINSDSTENGYSVYVDDNGILTLPNSDLPEDITTLMMGLREEKGAIDYKVSAFCNKEKAEVYMIVAVMNTETREYIGIQPKSSTIENMYQIEGTFTKLENEKDYTVEVIAWVTAPGYQSNGALYAKENLVTQ